MGATPVSLTREHLPPIFNTKVIWGAAMWNIGILLSSRLGRVFGYLLFHSQSYLVVHSTPLPHVWTFHQVPWDLSFMWHICFKTHIKGQYKPLDSALDWLVLTDSDWYSHTRLQIHNLLISFWSLHESLSLRGNKTTFTLHVWVQEISHNHTSTLRRFHMIC